ncbi:helix-turn-helix transcriptional regulator [Chryseobacterium sp. JAH]|uniref:helix-turn-helix transcriptional regulator n=1 Tax=Chryseobacterium sp. JAH TaxID=1742858 RepID=UPI0007411073|nr:helix-turn-helix transcriptional regulator [Chryseobacterium sp. JAH]KUJ49771.1 hypothetical protein AR685_17660 [Chryseobacterium sp. JAH]
MIKNEKQYAITNKKRKEFLRSLEKLQVDSQSNDKFKKIMQDAIKSQIETFDRELKEYEKLTNEKPIIFSSPIENLSETLIKARIVTGLSQNDLAKIVGLKEQQIQRYEANNYESANLERMLSIANAMNIHFDETRACIRQDIIKVKGYDVDFLKHATTKLQNRRSLFTV